MQTFSCKIELSGPAGTSSAEIQVDADVRTAIEWLMLGARRDSVYKSAFPSVTFDHVPGALVVRIDKNAASELAVARRIS